MPVVKHPLCKLATLGFLITCSIQAKADITVFAAASMTNALDEVAAQYQKTHHTKIITSYASSSTLARQVVQGAPVDLFISADNQWMDYLAKNHGIIESTRKPLLGNDLVVIANKQYAPKTFTINKNTPWLTLLNHQRLAMGDPAHVPAGIYAQQALTQLGAWPQVKTQLAPANSVRSALALVERQEAPLGIVYGSDAKASQKVSVVATFPENSHPPISYPAAVVKNAPAEKEAKAFLDYLSTPEAGVIFKHWGFVPQK